MAFRIQSPEAKEQGEPPKPLELDDPRYTPRLWEKWIHAAYLANPAKRSLELFKNKIQGQAKTTTVN